MAARLRPRHQEEIKQKIQVSQLVKLLHDHALKGEFLGREVNPSRIDAAKFLIGKVLGNPPQEITGAGGAALFKVKVEVSLVKPG